MKKIGLDQTISILANMGVIGGILLLAFELQQNNAALSLQARLDRENTLRQGLQTRINNYELLRASAKAKGNEPLSAEEELLVRDHNRSALMDWYLAYRQVQDGALSAESIPVSGWRYYFHHELPRMAESWDDFKVAFSPGAEYVEWFEENIIHAGPLE